MNYLKLSLILISGLISPCLLTAQGGCDTTVAPVNLESTVDSYTSVTVSWDSVHESVGCQIQFTDPIGNSILRIIHGPNVNSATTSISDFSVGKYKWQVQCACSETPLQLTPKSQIDSFVVVNTTSCGHVTDIDGNVYNTVKIGNQCWLKENLKTTHYSNGDVVINEPDMMMWGMISFGAWAYYDNDSTHNEIYGKLYNWYAAVDPRGLCPTNWHTPTEAEWDILENFLGGQMISGGKAKEAGFEHWYSPNDGATNESGFTALPAGFRGVNGFCATIGTCASFWSFDELDAFNAMGRRFNYIHDNGPHGSTPKVLGNQVRCISDSIEEKQTVSENEFKSEQNVIAVYPNPAENYINISCTKNIKSKMRFELYDISGKLAYADEWMSDDFSALRKLDVSSLAPGALFYKVYLDDKTYTGKIVKQ